MSLFTMKAKTGKSKCILNPSLRVTQHEEQDILRSHYIHMSPGMSLDGFHPLHFIPAIFHVSISETHGS